MPTLSSITAASGSTSNTALMASHTSLPSESPNLPMHSLQLQNFDRYIGIVVILVMIK